MKPRRRRDPIERQLVKAIRADPTFLDLICANIKRQQAQKPSSPEDLRRKVLAKRGIV